MRRDSVTREPAAPASAPGDDHPTVRWVRREIVPRLVETIRPERVVVFDPPDRPADATTRAPGLLVVASRFEGVAIAERVAIVRGALAAVAPVRPLCLTPAEARLADRVPGPVLAAARRGCTVL